MKRKAPTAPEPVIANEILESAKRSVMPDKLKRTTKCVVCGSECAPTSAEDLCWVCRRLKISAWREGDTQISAQE
jgi:hypothetical protein